MDRLDVTIPTTVLTGTGGGPRGRRRPAIFVAFRFNNLESRNFRSGLESGILSKEDVEVLDGHVDVGAWAPIVRKRIKQSKLVVVDVTGPSREVMFEFGFAGNKRLLLVVADGEDIDVLPRWITIDTVQAFGGSGLSKIVDTAVGELRRRNVRFGRTRPAADPNRVIWLQERSAVWCSEARTHFRNLAREFGLVVDDVYAEDLYSYKDLRKSLSASIVVGCIDGGDQDYAAHFFFGDIVGRPTAGSGSGKGEAIRRVAIVFARDETTMQTRVADSVMRVERDHIKLAADEVTLISHGRRLFRKHQRWLAGDDADGES